MKINFVIRGIFPEAKDSGRIKGQIINITAIFERDLISRSEKVP